MVIERETPEPAPRTPLGGRFFAFSRDTDNLIRGNTVEGFAMKVNNRWK